MKFLIVLVLASFICTSQGRPQSETKYDEEAASSTKLEEDALSSTKYEEEAASSTKNEEDAVSSTKYDEEAVSSSLEEYSQDLADWISALIEHVSHLIHAFMTPLASELEDAHYVIEEQDHYINMLESHLGYTEEHGEECAEEEPSIDDVHPKMDNIDEIPKDSVADVNPKKDKIDEFPKESDVDVHPKMDKMDEIPEDMVFGI